MFKLNRHRPGKAGDNIEFKFSHLQVSQDMNLSASGSHRSSDSGESFIGRTKLSPMNSQSGAYSQILRQDSSGSQCSSACAATEDASRSTSSLLNSKGAGPNRWQDRNGDPSKELLEAAQETIEELRGEARLWERNARKLKADLEALRKESSDQSRHQEDVEMGLKDAHMEIDNLKSEIERLRSSMKDFQATEAVSRSKFLQEGQIHRQKELEDELRFHKESNASLSLQLKKTQESNLELVSILQELEDTIEKQRLEITSFSEGTFGRKRSSEDEHMVDLAKKSPDFEDPRGTSQGSGSGNAPDLTREINTLKAKIQELERECTELTEENLGLMIKMKEPKKDIVKNEISLGCTPQIFLGKFSSSDPGSDIFQYMTKVHQAAEGLVSKEVGAGPPSEPSVILFKDLEKKCADLEVELQEFKDTASNLSAKLCESQKEVEKKSLELNDIRKKMKEYGQQDCFSEISTVLPAIYDQVRLSLLHMRSFPLSNINTETELSLDLIPCDIDSVSQKDQEEIIMRSLSLLSNLLETKNCQCKDMFQGGNLEIGQKNKSSWETHGQIKGCVSNEEEGSFTRELESGSRHLNVDLLGCMSDMEEMKARISLKEGEIDIQSRTKQELEDLFSGIQDEKSKLVEDLGIALTDNNISSKCLEDMNKEIQKLNTSMDSHILAKKLLERKSQELEKGKHELELHITELEKENVGLSERISGLEAQLRYLTNAKESSRLELENSRHLVMNLRDEIQTLGTDMEKEKEELHQKLQAAQGRLTEAVEETEYLKRSHSKLQVTVESLIEECSSLQRLTSDLKKQKLELHDHSTLLEVQLNESEKKNADFSNKLEIFETKLSMLQKDASFKERSLLSEVETMFQKQKEHEEKLSQANDLLNQMELEKGAELENLKREIAHLTAQLSLNHNEDETVTSDGIEVSELRADKVKLENSLQEIQSKAKSYEMQIQSIRQEFGSNTQSLIGLLNASKESEDMLMADIGHMKRQMEKMKSEEEKVKKLANELELKLKSSEYEKQQLLEEVSNLKVQLTKITQLQDEVTVLKGSLDEEKFKKTKLEQSLHVISEECEKLKAENSSCKEKISTMQKALFGLEGDRRTRVALEEKLLRLECDLNAKEALHAQEMELKNELSRMKRSNSQYQRKMQCIEEERDELTRKVQVLEKDLRSNKTESEDGERLPAVADKSLPHNMERSQSVNMDDLQAKIIPLQTELAEALETNNVYKEQLKRLLAEKEANAENASKNSAAEAAQVGGRDDRLETELKEMRERYLQMSLRYAEVEAQREDLVMKLKSTKKEKRWFS
ncbi:unnamed protein product [Spirodela intermedia]|uniref:Uncharacterized protein n=1 Tax=Spirodela intermedia TaxID=51605 RepID=A0A7I8K1Q2_SPIIN|nr:unnamed protein product [Spirodela intermedia]